MAFEASVHAKAIELARLAIEMTAAAGSGHPTSASSLAHIAAVLLYHHMRYDPADPANPAADRLVLSEGHACPIIYAAGADLGFPIGKDDGRRRRMTREDALSLRALDSEIDGHPNPAEGFPFFPAPTGSLGQGLSIAAGLALAARLDGVDRRVFCLIGDGESREGQIWEAVDFLVENGLASVCPIFNCNGFGQSDPVSVQQSPERTAAKLRAAGLEAAEIDGHDPAEISGALREHARLAGAPDGKVLAIVAHTIKGWGFSSVVEGGLHGKPLSGEKQKRALAELEETARRVGAKWSEGDLEIPETPGEEPAARERPGKPPSFTDAIRRYGPEELLNSGKAATRKAYGLALRALGHARPDVVALDGDVRNSTYSEYFHDDPELACRFFKCRIAEQNMISCAAGLAAGGKVPFVSTFGKFLMRGCDQLEMALIGRLGIKFVGSHTGVSLAADGPSQMALPDVAFFHAFAGLRDESGEPVMYLLTPSDAYAAYALTLEMARHEGACYLRTLRPDVPLIYDDRTAFTLGGHRVLVQGSDLLILASGYMVHEAREALPALQRKGLSPTLVDLYSLPFDRREIVELARANGQRVLTLEDNYAAGMGAAVAGALAESGSAFAFRQMYVRRIPKSARTPGAILDALELSAPHIVETCAEIMSEASQETKR